MSKKNKVAQITLLVHSQIAVFEWGKVIIDLFAAQAYKNVFKLNTVFDLSEVTDFNSPVMVLGVDSVWLDSVLEELNSKKCRTILFYGTAHKNYEYVSHISSGQGVSTKKAIQLLSERGRMCPALFGIQKNDTSDQIKANVFSEHFPVQDVYCVESGISECFDRFFSNLGKYDSVICANDVMAIYLISRFRELGMDIMDKLYLVGNGNLWLGAHVTPSITTFCSNSCATVQLALQICSILREFDDLDTIDASISTQLIPRESTADVCNQECTDSLSAQARNAYVEPRDKLLCSELWEIVTLDRKLSACSKDQLSVLSAWISGASIDRIAESLYISDNTVRYHLKSLYRLLNIHSKSELLQIANKYGLTLS